MNRLRLAVVLMLLIVPTVAAIGTGPNVATGRAVDSEVAAAGRYHAVRRRGALYDRSMPNRPSRGLYTVGR